MGESRLRSSVYAIGFEWTELALLEGRIASLGTPKPISALVDKTGIAHR
jgi:hypothetical protein